MAVEEVSVTSFKDRLKIRVYRPRLYDIAIVQFGACNKPPITLKHIKVSRQKV